MTSRMLINIRKATAVDVTLLTDDLSLTEIGHYERGKNSSNVNMDFVAAAPSWDDAESEIQFSIPQRMSRTASTWLP
jgi:hypothetical protein